MTYLPTTNRLTVVLFKGQYISLVSEDNQGMYIVAIECTNFNKMINRELFAMVYRNHITTFMSQSHLK